MSLARLVIEHAGPLTTIQDGGRRGYMRFGVPHSGPIGRLAFAAANAALGNHPAAAALELSLGGLTLSCDSGEVGFALCGGDFSAELDGTQLGPWTTGILRTGCWLRVRPGTVGNWAYLAFAGRFEARAWLGSSSTHMLAGLGGGAITTGAALAIDAVKPPALGAIPRPPLAEPITTARVVIGPQDRFFPPEALLALTAEPFAATPRLDRMGMVLAGPSLIPQALDMISEPALRGALQVNGAGETTLLLADHQTTGGYPKIAAVLTADADRIAQLRPGAELRFKPVSAAEAVRAARAAQRLISNYLDGLSPGHEPLEAKLGRLNLVDGVMDGNAEQSGW